MNISLAAEPVFHIGSFPVTNTLLTSWIAILLLLIGGLVLRKRMKDVPRGFQNVIETMFESMLSVMDSITGNREQTKMFFPLIATLFLFILLANWLGLVPGFGTIGLREVHEGKNIIVPFLRSTNSDLNMTLGMAIVSVLAIQIFGVILIGAVKYSKRFFNFSNPIMTFVGLIELVSEVAKLLSFSFRLFGNVFAGEVLLVVISSLVPYIVPLPFYFLELFVGFIQAMVFAMLTLVFLKVATVESHES